MINAYAITHSAFRTVSARILCSWIALRTQYYNVCMYTAMYVYHTLWQQTFVRTLSVSVCIYISYVHSCTEHTFKSQAYITLYPHLVNAPPPEEVIGSSESACVCVCMHVSICLCLCVSVCMYTCLVIVHTARKTHVWTFICMYRCVYDNLCACIDGCVVCVRDSVIVHTACKTDVWTFISMYKCVYDNLCACIDGCVCVRDLDVVWQFMCMYRCVRVCAWSCYSAHCT